MSTVGEETNGGDARGARGTSEVPNAQCGTCQAYTRTTMGSGQGFAESGKEISISELTTTSFTAILGGLPNRIQCSGQKESTQGGARNTQLPSILCLLKDDCCCLESLRLRVILQLKKLPAQPRLDDVERSLPSIPSSWPHTQAPSCATQCEAPILPEIMATPLCLALHLLPGLGRFAESGTNSATILGHGPEELFCAVGKVPRDPSRHQMCRATNSRCGVPKSATCRSSLIMNAGSLTIPSRSLLNGSERLLNSSLEFFGVKVFGHEGWGFGCGVSVLD